MRDRVEGQHANPNENPDDYGTGAKAEQRQQGGLPPWNQPSELNRADERRDRADSLNRAQLAAAPAAPPPAAPTSAWRSYPTPLANKAWNSKPTPPPATCAGASRCGAAYARSA